MLFLQYPEAPLRRRSRHILDDFEDLAPAGHPVAPDAIEIGDERRDLLRSGRALRRIEVGEFVKGIMNRRVAPAPASPTASRPEHTHRPRQVIGCVPVVERRPVCLVRHFGAHHDICFGHNPFPYWPASPRLWRPSGPDGKSTSLNHRPVVVVTIHSAIRSTVSASMPAKLWGEVASQG